MHIKGPHPFVASVSLSPSRPASSIGPGNRTDSPPSTISSSASLKQDPGLMKGHAPRKVVELAKRRLVHARKMEAAMKSLDALRSQLDTVKGKIDQLQQRREVLRVGSQVQAQARQQPVHPQPAHQQPVYQLPTLRLVAGAIQKAYPAKYARYPTSFGMGALRPRVAFPGFMAAMFGSSLLGAGMLAALLF